MEPSPISLAEWRKEIEPWVREYLSDCLLNNPEFLFDEEGGPAFMRADLVLARLIGTDEQIVDDSVMLNKVEPEYFVPKLTRVNAWLEPEKSIDQIMLGTIPMRRFVLHSGWAQLSLNRWSSMPLPDSIDPSLNEVRIVFVRYVEKVDISVGGSR